MEMTLLNILKEQVVPAFGCTEPVAVAYAVAKAKEVLDGPIIDLDITVDKNVYKNAVAVFIPGTGKRGIAVAAALSIVCGKSEYELQVLKNCRADDLSTALNIVDQGFIRVYINKSAQDLFIEVAARDGKSMAKVVIRDKHNNIVLVEKDGNTLFSGKTRPEDKKASPNTIQNYKISDLVAFADAVHITELSIVDEGIEMNKNMAEAWFKDNDNHALGYLEKNASDLSKYAKAMTAAACSARMTGYPLPVMSCTGSGNHGITAIVPVAAVGEVNGIEKEKIVRAVTLSALVTTYIKSYTKTLSPVCGCAVAAGIGASAGIAYMLGGDQQAIDGAINNMIGGLSGMFCDGGKPGCAFKLSIAAGAALEAAMMALKGEYISPLDGIVDCTVEKSIQNMGIVSTAGMSNTDEVILDVMLKKASC